jgi:hypothetical protein
MCRLLGTFSGRVPVQQREELLEYAREPAVRHRGLRRTVLPPCPVPIDIGDAGCGVAIHPVRRSNAAAGAIGVSQVVLLVSVAFWTWLWGPLGLLMASPLTVCLVVLGKHVPGLAFVGLLMDPGTDRGRGRDHSPPGGGGTRRRAVPLGAARAATRPGLRGQRGRR